MLNLTSTIPEVLILLWKMLVTYLYVELDLHNTRGPDPGFSFHILMLNLTSKTQKVVTLVWRMFFPYLDVELELHNTRGPDPVWRMVVPYLDVKLDLHNARGPDSGVEDVLCGWDVGVLSQSLHAVQKIPGKGTFYCRNRTSFDQGRKEPTWVRRL
jgi:hypothetical protein